jgi:hypothetical protein
MVLALPCVNGENVPHNLDAMEREALEGGRRMLESNAPNEIVLGQIIQPHVANLHQPPDVIADSHGENDVLLQFFGRP